MASLNQWDLPEGAVPEALWAEIGSFYELLAKVVPDHINRTPATRLAFLPFLYGAVRATCADRGVAPAHWARVFYSFLRQLDVPEAEARVVATFAAGCDDARSPWNEVVKAGVAARTTWEDDSSEVRAIEGLADTLQHVVGVNPRTAPPGSPAAAAARVVLSTQPGRMLVEYA